jgi:membrane-bound ClpP family serine protease
MNEREGAMRVVGRYVLFQVPGWALMIVAAEAAVLWLGVPPRWAWGAVGLWVLKDVAMFPLLRKAYRRDGSIHGHVGDRGVADGAIDPDGWVRIGPERWRARLASGAGAIEAGAPVRVVAMDGLELRVTAAPADEIK